MKIKLLIAILFFIAILILYTKPQSITGRQLGSAPLETSINQMYDSLNVTPMFFEFKIPPGNSNEKSIDISAELPGNTGLNVTLSKSGEVADWIDLEASTISLVAEELQTLNFNVTTPFSQALGIYYGWINVSSEDGQKKDVNITINVTKALGRINVTVNNTIGNAVQYATMFIWNPIPSLVDSGSTDGNGNWISSWLESGNYTVEVVKSGYRTKQINVTVNSEEIKQVFITLLPIAAPVLDVSPSSITESTTTGNTVTKILTISNIGDMNLINITLNSTYSWITFSNNSIPLIVPDNYTYVNAYLGPLSNVGTYLGTIFINSSNDGNKIIPVAFQVSSGGGGGGAAGGGAGGGGVQRPLEGNLSIFNFTDRIVLEQGDIEFVTVHVNNTGKTILTDTKLNIIGVPDEISYSIDPEIIDIPINDSQTFVVMFKVPLNFTVGDYPIAFKVTSGNVTDSRAALLEINERSGEIEVIRLEDLKISKFFVNETGAVNITVANGGTIPLNVTAYLYLPENLSTKESIISKIIYPFNRETFSFSVISDKEGTFTINAVILSNRKEISEDIIINVYTRENVSATGFLIWFALIVIILILSLIIINIVIRRRNRQHKNYEFKTFFKNTSQV